jgi:hypothetical protein
VQRLPDERRPDLLARIRLTGRGEPDPTARELADAISRRRTDRRAFGDRRVADDTVTRLRRLVEAEGTYLHVVPDDRVAEMAVSVDQAADAEYFDPAYRSELTAWTSRPAWTGDGVPPATAVQPSLRRVPVRNFLPDGSPGLLAGADHDEGAVFVILLVAAIGRSICCAAGRQCRHCCWERRSRACPPHRSARRSRWRGPAGCCAGCCPRPVNRT